MYKLWIRQQSLNYSILNRSHTGQKSIYRVTEAMENVVENLDDTKTVEL
jgi:hypothetical protein